MKKILSIGTMYLDISCTNFPFDQGLFAHRETVGDQYELDLGGSALNFAKVASQLGMDVSFMGKAGTDEVSSTVINLLTQNNINPLIMYDPDRQTNLAMHYVHADGTSIMTSCGNANQSLSIDDIEEEQFDNILDDMQYLYLGGVFKLKKLLPHLHTLARKAKEKNVLVILDHGRVNNSVTMQDINHLYTLFPYIDIYLPSIDEFLAVWERTTVEESFAKMSEISKPLTIIKQAEKGAVGFVEDTIIPVEAYSISVLNTVGAGDSFNAGFITAYSQNFSMEEAIKYGCATSAIKISTTDTLTKQKVDELFGS